MGENRIDFNLSTVNDLPDELIIMVLQYNDYREISRFGATCKRFNNLVNTNQCLWKEKAKFIFPVDILNEVKQHCKGNWLNEIKWFFNLKQRIYTALIDMSRKFYRQTDVTLEDVREFFTISLENKLSFYCTIYLLQDVIKKAKKNVNELKGIKPFTLTESYYAKIALRHLMHTYLALKWVRGFIKNELTPEIMVNFFLQWVDAENIYLDEDIEDKITELAEEVEKKLLTKCKSCKPCTEKLTHIKEDEIFAAVAEVLYPQELQVTSAATFETLNIVKVLNNNPANIIAMAAIYHALIRRFGIKCELIAFPNHLFLEWKDDSNPEKPLVYTIDLNTGKLYPKRRCPFSQGNQYTNYKYQPDSFLQYIYSAFFARIGAIGNWNTENAVQLQSFLSASENELNPYRNVEYFSYRSTQNVHIQDFLRSSESGYNPYKSFLSYLYHPVHLPAMNIPLNLRYLNDVHLEILITLGCMHTFKSTNERNVEVKKRNSQLKFAVGMICYHTKYDYMCVIRGWDLTCAIQMNKSLENHRFNPNQPFYHVIAADQSERYVAQEHLIEARHPTRIFDLEDKLAREFTHFNGFAYVLNEEKRIEYPEEAAISNLFREKLSKK